MTTGGGTPSQETVRTPAGSPRPTEAIFQGGPSAQADAEDASIVAKVVAGDRDAYGTLVERHQDRVFRLAMRLANNDRGRAEDIAQEAFLRAYRGLAGFEHGARFSTWLHRVTVNVAISEIRRRRAAKRGKALSLDAPIGGEEDFTLASQVSHADPGPAAGTLAEERRRHVLAAVEALEPDLKTLVVLVNFEGKSYEEAAEICSIPIGTVRSRLHRAREVLEEHLRRTLRFP